jgi:hypothetical protein
MWFGLLIIYLLNDESTTEIMQYRMRHDKIVMNYESGETWRASDLAGTSVEGLGETLG